MFRRGNFKPPPGRDQVNWRHPFVRELLFGAWFNHYPQRTHLFGFDNTNVQVVPVFGKTRPRLVQASTASVPSANYEGGCLDFTSDGSGGTVSWNTDPIPADKITICLIRRKMDATFRNPGFTFGISGTGGGSFDQRCNAHLPFSDGTAYWDFGGVTSPNRISAAGLTFSGPTTLPERWVFVAGPRGMAMWQNGVKVQSTATANPGRTVGTNEFRLNFVGGGGFSENGDIQEINFFMALDTEWDDALCRWWSEEPYAHLYGGSAVADLSFSPPASVDVRITQIYTEALTQNAAADIRLTRLYTEALTQNAAADIRITQLYVEALYLSGDFIGNSAIPTSTVLYAPTVEAESGFNVLSIWP